MNKTEKDPSRSHQAVNWMEKVKVITRRKQHLEEELKEAEDAVRMWQEIWWTTQTAHFQNDSFALRKYKIEHKEKGKVSENCNHNNDEKNVTEKRETQ